MRTLIIIALFGFCSIANAAEKATPISLAAQAKATANLRLGEKIAANHRDIFCRDDVVCAKRYNDVSAKFEELVVKLPNMSREEFEEAINPLIEIGRKVEEDYDPSRKQATR